MNLSGYFDFNATTPLLRQARAALLQALEGQWQNPSSLYHSAGLVRQALEETREGIADLLGIDDPRRVVFTSGATEANNLVLRHHAATASSEASVLTSDVEHPCVREPAATLFPDRFFQASSSLEEILDLTRKHRPCLVSIMAVNNETGVLLPWREVQAFCRQESIPFHTDAAQWLGKMPLEGLEDCDWITGSAHKFGGPKGTGFLVIPGSLPKLHGAFEGGPQENRLRAGTENAPGILAMHAALTEADQRRSKTASSGRDAFESRMRELLPGIRFIGSDSPRLWNTSMMVLPEYGNLKWLTRLSHLGFQLSTGSACSSGKENPSHVMEAMGLPPDQMGRVLRASSGWQTTMDDWNRLAEALFRTWLDLQNPSAEERDKRKLEW